MKELFKPIYLDIKDKSGNLDIETSGVVKSTKYFPKYILDNEEYIFKPLSKTKPYTTPLFAYAEVFWSYLTKKFFDPNAPLYKLAYAQGLEKEQEKYYDYGTLVKSTINSNQKLINLYEYFQKYPEESFDISDYVNYCMKTYDYSQILRSEFLTLREDLGRKVAWQVLQSILRCDQNFHYENVNFIIENKQIIDINPPIDYEFSNMFLFPDNKEEKDLYIKNFKKKLQLTKESDDPLHYSLLELLRKQMDFKNPVTANLCTIVKLYPDIVEEFIALLEPFRNEVRNFVFRDDYNYIVSCNSQNWIIGDLKYKKSASKEEINQKAALIKPITIVKEEIFEEIKDETIEISWLLEKILRIYLYAKQENIEDLEGLTYEKFRDLINSKSMEETSKLRYILQNKPYK